MSPEAAIGCATLILVRHPRPVVAPNTCYGRLDVEADPGELAALVERLSGALPRDARLASSPLRRCADVARGLQAAGFAAPRFDARLAEMHFGDWEGRSWDDIPRTQVDAWSADVAGYRPPGGETVTELAHRAAAALRELLDPPGTGAAARTASPPPLVVITHAGVIQTATRMLAGAPLEGFGGTRVAYGEVVTLRRVGASLVRDAGT